MQMQMFSKMKNELELKLGEAINECSDASERRSYEIAIKILNSITLENMKLKKGLLSHFIVDSYTGKQKLGSELIFFDEMI